MKLAIVLFCSAFVFGQSTSTSPTSMSGPRTESSDLKAARGCHGNLEVLSDTQGVDFSPYLQRVLNNIGYNWHRLIPESAVLKKGKLAVEFAIKKDGVLSGMRIVASFGDVDIDRPAWGSIVKSDPFPPLPGKFAEPDLALRLRFVRNPDNSDEPCVEVSISPSGDLQVPVGGSNVVAATVTGTKEKNVDWIVTGLGCSGSACGAVTNDSYRAPSVMPAPPLVTLTAISIADPTARTSVRVHIVQATLLH